MNEKPKVVCLCGSTHFKQAFFDVARDRTLKGEIVLTVHVFRHIEGEGESRIAVLAMLDALHRRKIDLADYVLVLNVGGYIGDGARGEIEYATALGKPVEYLEPIAV